MNTLKDSPSPSSASKKLGDEQVVEYLKQRLASVVASGSATRTMEEANEVKSHFSMDLDDEELDFSAQDDGVRDGDVEGVHDGVRAEAWDKELDPAWIIDRYCSWQEEDLDDALMEVDEVEENELNRVLGKEWKEWKVDQGREENVGDGIDADSKDELTMKRLARIAKIRPVFADPLLSRSPSPSPPPGPASIDNDRLSTSNTLVEVPFPCTPPILSPGMSGAQFPRDEPQPILTLDLVHDCSFHASTAFLLGPDFGCDVDRMAKRFKLGEESAKENASQSTHSSAPHPSTTNDDRVLNVLESLDMSWKTFWSKGSVQKYLNTSVPPNDSWDFGICFDRGDGSQHCAVMHARGVRRTYTDHTAVREGVPAGNDVLAPGCKHLFWWCRPHPQWKEANHDRRTRAKILEEHYEEAKSRIEQFKQKQARWMKISLQQSYTQLLLDLPDRERTTGRFSIHSMNTVLQLAELSELLDRLLEANEWNRELVRRRAKRLGRDSIHTCQARYRHAQLLFKMEKYDRARDVSQANLEALTSFDNTYPLVAKQNILACAIAFKRRRFEHALEVLEHLWSLETNHPSDLQSKETALEILYDAHSAKREYVEAEGFKRKQIDMYEEGYGKARGKGLCYYQLAVCLRRQSKFNDAVETSKKAISVFKECIGAAEEDLFDAYQLLGNCLFDMKEWNKARFFIEKAVKGYELNLGSKADKTEKAKEALKVLDKHAYIKAGLAEKLVQQAEKNKMKRKF